MAKAAVKTTAKKPVERMVESLKVFREQVNAIVPKRSKSSDGWIGDAKHSARHSDHNPEPDGTVDAFDLTNDPSGGVDIQKVADALVASKDKRISYIICNGKIVSGNKGPKPWVWRKYSGANGHYHHMHLSVLDEFQDDKTPWKISSAFKKTPAKPSDVGLTNKQVSATLKKDSKGEFVEELQKNLRKLGYNINPDGHFGTATEAAIKNFQKANNLEVDGWAGPRTLEAIARELEANKLKPKIAEAEAKADIAGTIVAENAAEGKKLSTTEWLGGIVGVGGTASIVKQVTDTIRETSESVGQLVVSLGPWLLLGVVVVGAAIYIVYDRRNRRLEARAVQKVL